MKCSEMQYAFVDNGPSFKYQQGNKIVLAGDLDAECVAGRGVESPVHRLKALHQRGQRSMIYQIIKAEIFQQRFLVAECIELPFRNVLWCGLFERISRATLKRDGDHNVSHSFELISVISLKDMTSISWECCLVFSRLLSRQMTAGSQNLENDIANE